MVACSQPAVEENVSGSEGSSSEQTTDSKGLKNWYDCPIFRESNLL